MTMTEKKLSKIEKFRHELNRVFDDNLRTKQWHNYVDYAIIGLIIISTVEVFLSTYDGIVEKYGKWQIPRGETEKRLQLYETLRFSRPNAYDLILHVDGKNDDLCIFV